MIFPFELTRNYKLPESEFGDFTSEEIIDNIYNGLLSEKFKWISKQNRTIKFAGDKLKWHYIIFWQGSLTHCVDTGILRISENGNYRTIKYSYRIVKLLYILLIPSIIISTLVGFGFKSLDIGILIFYLSTSWSLLTWILSLIFHPIIISPEIEKMRYKTIRKRIEKQRVPTANNIP